ncbi:flavodoxin family protein, partial [Candidatus Bathyarchaeota archaeon]|nr:flavodoxin family protein [Candidatus Bathyarchaeota archaeon]
MKVLGLIGSYRKLGNTEVLVKEALMEAQKLGAQVDVLRLTDLKIEPCKGCMACVFKQEECKIQDDWNIFRKKLDESDAVIIGAPTYLLGPAGIVKMIIDRNISLQTRTLHVKSKRGAIIGVAGIKGWEPFTMALLNVFMFTCGIKVVDQAIFYAQGPGEILLDETAMERARKLGKNVLQTAIKPAEDQTYLGEQGICPVCHQNLFSLKNGILECALCQAKAKPEIINNKIKL